MKYVYILQSEQDAGHFYTGITDDLRARLSKHNSGDVAHTAKYSLRSRVLRRIQTQSNIRELRLGRPSLPVHSTSCKIRSEGCRAAASAEADSK